MSSSKHYLIIAGSLLVILIIAGFVLDRFFPAKPVQSASTDNVSGWAWSNMEIGGSGTTIGWISFNSTNCDTDDNGFSNGGAGCPAAGTAIAKYGVNVNSSTGDFLGYAWSENIGWISFNRTVAGNPPAAPYNGGSGPIANLDFATKRVRGWARALAACQNDLWDGTKCTGSGAGNAAGGWDGWIKLGDGGTWPGGGSPPSLNSQVYIQTQAGPDEFRGWAWGDMIIGWISFNCADRGVCGSSSYKVVLDINFPPTATCNDTTDNQPQIPCSDSRNPTLEWTYFDVDGDTQQSYRVNIDADLNFTLPLVIDTGEVFSSGTSYKPSGTTLNWGTPYWWRVKVRDSRGVWSDWSVSSLQPSEKFCDFTTLLHAYPNCLFTKLPTSPSALEDVRFTDTSKCYDNNPPTEDDCSATSPPSPLGKVDAFLWNFNAGTPPNPGTVNWDPDIPLTPTLETPVVSFSNPGPWTVKLRVTDSDGYWCEYFEDFNVQYPLPGWKEVIPR